MLLVSMWETHIPFSSLLFKHHDTPWDPGQDEIQLSGIHQYTVVIFLKYMTFSSGGVLQKEKILQIRSIQPSPSSINFTPAISFFFSHSHFYYSDVFLNTTAVILVSINQEALLESWITWKTTQVQLYLGRLL